MSEMLQDFKKWTVICIVACIIALLCVVADTGMYVYKEYFADGCETEYAECGNSRGCGCMQCDGHKEHTYEEHVHPNVNEDVVDVQEIKGSDTACEHCKLHYDAECKVHKKHSDRCEHRCEDETPE